MEQMWKNNKMELKVQIITNLVPIFIALTPNLFHHNNVGVTYEITSNFIMELVRSIPLFFVVMRHSMVTIIETPFIITPTHTIVSMRSKPQTPKGTDLVSMHTKMPK
jgi:hypothetical protein